MSSVYDKVKAIADERNLTISAIENGAQISNGSIMKWKKVFRGPIIFTKYQSF